MRFSYAVPKCDGHLRHLCQNLTFMTKSSTRRVTMVVSPKVCNFQQNRHICKNKTKFLYNLLKIKCNSPPHLKLFPYLCTQLIRNARFFHISPTKPNTSAGKLSGNGVLYLLRKRERLGNLAIVLWRTLLHQRFVHLAQRGPDE